MSSSALLAAGHVLLGGGAGAAPTSDAALDDGQTTANTLTYTGTAGITAASFQTNATTPGKFLMVAGTGNIPALVANSAGFAAPVTGGTSYLIKPPATITAGIVHLAAPATGDGVNESAMTSSAVNLASADVTGLLPHANIASTAVTPGSYTNANITVAADGSVTAASNGTSGTVTDGAGTTTANKLAVSTTTAHVQGYIDFPMLYDVPAANCNNATAGTGWSLPTASAPTVACRTGTNVQAGVLQFADGQSAQFNVALPGDYDSAGTVYARIRFTQGTNTTSGQTIIMQLATGCSTTTDDPTFNAAQSFGTATTTTTANTPFDETLSTVTMTGCTAGHTMNVKISRTTDTATVAPNVYFVTLTIPRLLVNQAN